jgi:DNA-binding response OmpR family regulator
MTLRAMIVDDSDDFLHAARVLLERGGFTVVAAVSTGVQALKSAVEHKPDVVLVDVGLVGESGFDVAERLCGTPGRRWQVVLISARSVEEYEDLLETTPALGFVPKAHLSAAAITSLLEHGLA